MSTEARKRKAVKAQLRNTPDEDPEFQIAPMVDVLLVLLVFFMSISSTQVLQAAAGVDLPIAVAGKQPGEIEEGQVIINVRWLLGVGSLEINQQVYSDPEAIKPLLRDAKAATPQLRVLIRADKAVRFEFMRAIMKAAADSNIGNVTFSVVDKEGETPAE